MPSKTYKVAAVTNTTYAGFINGGSHTFSLKGDVEKDTGSFLIATTQSDIPDYAVVNKVHLIVDYTSDRERDYYASDLIIYPYPLSAYSISGQTYSYTAQSGAVGTFKFSPNKGSSTITLDITGYFPGVNYVNRGIRLAAHISQRSAMDWFTHTLTFRNLRVYVEWTIPRYTLTVTAGTGGTVSGGGTFDYGTTRTITATANSGYRFVKWSDGNTNATRTVTVTGNATYTATFEPTAKKNIYVGANQVKDLYIGTSKVKEVYVGNTKVYG